MPGARSHNFRLGDRTELLVEFILSTLAFTSRVPRQEDVGHDFFCALAEPHDDGMLWAGPAFTVQAKSNLQPLTFATAYEKEWLAAQENAFFVAVGDRERIRVDLYSTWRRLNGILASAPDRVVLAFGEQPAGRDHVVETEDGRVQTIYMGKPVLSLSAAEAMDMERSAVIRGVLRQWIEIDRENIVQARAGVHWVLGPAVYETNVPPTTAHQVATHGIRVFWNPKNMPTCQRNFVRTAAALWLTAKAAGENGLASRQSAALEALLRAFVDDESPVSRELLVRYGFSF